MSHRYDDLLRHRTKPSTPEMSYIGSILSGGRATFVVTGGGLSGGRSGGGPIPDPKVGHPRASDLLYTSSSCGLVSIWSHGDDV
jgi:hypothetical protein